MNLEAELPDLSAPISAARTSCPTEASILAGLERKEPWAAAELFDRLESVVERSLFRILAERGPDFEDLVQVTFERIVRTLVERKFAAQCSLSTWAAAIATNVGIDAVRQRIRERRIFGAVSVDVADRDGAARYSSVARFESRTEIQRLQRVLAQMNQGQAEAVYLHDGMGYDLAEIAELAGISVAAAQSRLVRGRKEFLRRVKAFKSGGRVP